MHKILSLVIIMSNDGVIIKNNVFLTIITTPPPPSPLCHFLHIGEGAHLHKTVHYKGIS